MAFELKEKVSLVRDLPALSMTSYSNGVIVHDYEDGYYEVEFEQVGEAGPRRLTIAARDLE